MCDGLGSSSFAAAVEITGHSLAGLAGFLLLPLFHFQLFFFLLESMGGNGFVVCLGWVLVPSVVTRVPRLRSSAAYHLRVLQAAAGCLLAGSLAAGAAGLLTARLAMSAVGLAVLWGGCQAPHWGAPQIGAGVMDGLLSGNHLALALHLLAGLLSPPSPDLRFLRSLSLPALLLLGLWAAPPRRHRHHRDHRRHCGLPWRHGTSRGAWRYLSLFDRDRGAGGDEGGGRVAGDRDGEEGGERRLQEIVDPHLEWQRRRQAEEINTCAAASSGAVFGAASPRGGYARDGDDAGDGGGSGGGNGGGQRWQGRGIELAANRGSTTGPGHQPGTKRTKRRREVSADGDGAAPSTSTATPATASLGAPGSLPSAALGGGVASIESSVAPAGQVAQVAATHSPAPSRTRDRLLAPQAGSSINSSSSSAFLESLVASAGFGGLLFLTVLLAGSPWTGDEWAPSPGLGAGWSALRQASVVLAWGLGRTASVLPAAAAARSAGAAIAARGDESSGDWARRGVDGSPASPEREVLTTRVSCSPPSSTAAAESEATGEAAAASEGFSPVGAAARRDVGAAPTTTEFSGGPAATATGACFIPATALLAGLSAIALWPEQPLAIVPGIVVVALALPSLWRHLGEFRQEGSGTDGAAVYILLTVWETALVAFEYAPPLRPLRGTRPALLAAAGLLSAAPSLLTGVRSRKMRKRGGGVGQEGLRFGDARGAGVGAGVGVGVGVGGGGGGGGGARTTERLAWHRWRRPSSVVPGGGENGTGDCFALLESPVAAAAAAAAVTVAIALGLALGAPSFSTAALAGEGARCPTAAMKALEWPGAAKSVENVTKVRVVNFNVYMGYDRRGEDNTFRVAKLLEQLDADVAALQETGLMRLTLGNRRYAGAVARAAGMALAASAPVAEDTWGCAILSRLPVLSWGWRRLPRGPGENACEAHATLSLGPGRGVATVVNVHLGNEGDTEMQVTGLLSLLEDLRKPDLPEQRLRNWVTRKQGGHLRREGLSNNTEHEADRSLFIVIGDFNFDSSSSGYNRLVSGAGGLQSAAANCTPAAATTAAGVGATAAIFEPPPSDVAEKKERRSGYEIVRDVAESGGADYLGGDDDDGQVGDDSALDFVFYGKEDDGIWCGGYEVHREFSQQRFADGYPSVTEFSVSCPSV